MDNQPETTEQTENNSAESQTSENKVTDEQNERVMAIIAYLGILWIVPLLVAKDSEFAMYHANQGLTLFIAEMILIAISIIPILGWIVGLFGWIAAIILAILGIINAANMKKKPLPLIGKYQFLK